MMITATLTSKGQLTIPKAIRDSLSLHAGDRVMFTMEKGEVVMKPVTKSVDEVFGKLHDPATPAVSVEEMKQAVSERLRTKNR